MTAGSSNTGLMKEAHTAASVRMATVIREETATATEAMASPSGVLGCFLVRFMAFAATGSFRFMMLPVMKAR